MPVLLLASAELHVLDGVPTFTFVQAKYTIEARRFACCAALRRAVLLACRHPEPASCRCLIRCPPASLTPPLFSPPLQTSEAERIGVDQVAKILPTGANTGANQRACLLRLAPCLGLPVLCLRPPHLQASGAEPSSLPSALPRSPRSPRPAVTAHLSSMHSAINMLITRVGLLHQLLLKMQSGGWVGCQGRCALALLECCWDACTLAGLPRRRAANQPLPSNARRLAGELPFDHDIVRRAAGLIGRLPAVDSEQFGEDYTTVSWSDLVAAAMTRRQLSPACPALPLHAA